MSDLLAWLQAFYRDQCDGAREHQAGISIETVDNQGWLVEIDIEGTRLARRAFRPVQTERSEHDWLQCHMDSGSFIGAGGPDNLTEILTIFRDWAETPSSPN